MQLTGNAVQDSVLENLPIITENVMHMVRTENCKHIHD